LFRALLLLLLLLMMLVVVVVAAVVVRTNLQALFTSVCTIFYFFRQSSAFFVWASPMCTHMCARHAGVPARTLTRHYVHVELRSNTEPPNNREFCGMFLGGGPGSEARPQIKESDFDFEWLVIRGNNSSSNNNQQQQQQKQQQQQQQRQRRRRRQQQQQQQQQPGEFVIVALPQKNQGQQQRTGPRRPPSSTCRRARR
jgi:hypothetical protein